MPNWCQNRLVVEGEPEEIERFRNDVREEAVIDCRRCDGEGEYTPYNKTQPITCPICKGEKLYKYTAELLFAKVIPEPPEGDPRRKPSTMCEGGWDWYTWRTANWGTKWDLGEDTKVEVHRSELRYRFDTAWSPPIEAFRSIALAYPELTFRLAFMELGGGFCGTYVVRDEAEEEHEAELQFEEGDDGEVRPVGDTEDFVTSNGFGTYF